MIRSVRWKLRDRGIQTRQVFTQLSPEYPPSLGRNQLALKRTSDIL